MTRKVAPASPETCETCDRTAPSARRHPCRFERACACWYGVPCYPAGASHDAMMRHKRERAAFLSGAPIGSAERPAMIGGIPFIGRGR